MLIDKPKLSIPEQVEHLRNNGVRFEIMTADQAAQYLTNNNNYFKLTAYRKNYPKHPDGKDGGKYIDLDFAYLVDLAVIDMDLRYVLVHMALDVEHYAKMQLLHKVENSEEDGYQIVIDYEKSLAPDQLERFKADVGKNKDNIYCGNIIRKYAGHYPIWALLEIISFGRLIDFYKFCAKRFSDVGMTNTYFRLLTCKEIRNACAHSNCILNDLHNKTSRHDSSHEVTKDLGLVPGISKSSQNRKMSNAHIQQIVTLLYTHKDIITSEGVHEKSCIKLQEISKRMYRNVSYYTNNALIMSSFRFLKLIIDNWFPA